MAAIVTGILGILQQIFCSPQQNNQTQPPTHETQPQVNTVHAQVQQQQPQPINQWQQPHPQIQQQAVGQWQQPHQEHRPPSHSPPHAQESKPHRPYRNENLINQNNDHYKQLRAQAKEEGDAMGRCFDESHRVYQGGDGARAKELSNEGHAHQKRMNELNSQASEWIFQANNTDSGPGEIDLHGLYVKEAITYTERSIQQAQSRGDKEIHLIVGKGLHSADHVAKIKPAIEELIQKYNLVAKVDEQNSGVLIVALNGQGADRGLGVDDITRRLEKKDQDCVIM